MPGIKPAAIVGARNRTGQPITASPALHAEAVRRGWRITEHGHIDAGVTDGPCSRCRRPCHRYGTGGGPLCAGCRNSPDQPPTENVSRCRTLPA